MKTYKLFQLTVTMIIIVPTISAWALMPINHEAADVFVAVHFGATLLAMAVVALTAPGEKEQNVNAIIALGWLVTQLANIELVNRVMCVSSIVGC